MLYVKHEIFASEICFKIFFYYIRITNETLFIYHTYSRRYNCICIKQRAYFYKLINIYIDLIKKHNFLKILDRSNHLY